MDENRQNAKDEDLKVESSQNNDLEVAKSPIQKTPSLPEGKGTVVDVQKDDIGLVDIQKGESKQDSQDKCNKKELNISETSTEMIPSLSENTNILHDIHKSETKRNGQDNNQEKEHEITELLIDDLNQSLTKGTMVDVQKDDIGLVDIQKGESKQDSQDKCNKKELNISESSTEMKPSLSENTDILHDIHKGKTERNCQDNNQEKELETTKLLIDDLNQSLTKGKGTVVEQKDDIGLVDIQKGESKQDSQDKCNKKELNISKSSTEMKPSLSENTNILHDIHKGETERNCQDNNQEKENEITKLLIDDPVVDVQKDEVMLVDTQKGGTNQEPQDETTNTKAFNINASSIDVNPSFSENTDILNDIQKGDTNECFQNKCNENKFNISEEQIVKTETLKIENENKLNSIQKDASDHINKECPQQGKRPAYETQEGPTMKKSKVPVCLLCNEMGHKKARCPKKSQLAKVNSIEQRVVQSKANTKAKTKANTNANNVEQHVVQSSGIKDITDQDKKREHDDLIVNEDTSASKTSQDPQPESRAASTIGVRILVKHLPNTWTVKEVMQFLQENCDAVMVDMTKVIMLKDKVERNWGLEFTSANACAEALALLSKVGYIEGKEIVSTLIKDQPCGVTEQVRDNKTLNKFIETRKTTMPYPAFSRDLLMTYKAKLHQEETYGLNKDFMKYLGITVPLTPKIVVKNVHNEVTEEKMHEVFRIAGHVLSITMKQEDFSTTAFIEFQHPVEAVQAISLFHNQELHGKKMNVMQDKIATKSPVLPEGLPSLGFGLGDGGLPLRNVWHTMEVVAVRQKLSAMADRLDAVEMMFNKKRDSAKSKNKPENTPHIQSATDPSNLPCPMDLVQTLTENKANIPQSLEYVPQHYVNVPQQQMDVAEYFTNVPQHPVNVPLFDISVPSNLYNTYPYYGMNVPNNHMIEKQPDIAAAGQLPMNKFPGLPQEMVSGKPCTKRTAQKEQKEQNSVWAKTVNRSLGSGSKAHNATEFNQITVVKQFLDTVRSKEIEDADYHRKNDNKRDLYSPISLSDSDDHDRSPKCARKTKTGWSLPDDRKSKYNKDDRSRRSYDKLKENEKHRGTPSDRLLFDKLPSSVTKDQLENKMSELGRVLCVDFLRPGRALLRYRDPRDAARCIKLYDGSKVDGQTIYVSYHNTW